MAKQLFLNNFVSQFAAAVKDVASTGTPATELDYGILRLSDGAAGALLNPTGGDYYLLTAYKRVGSTESMLEIMRVTNVDNSVPGECRITVLRAQEGTTTKAYVTGDYIALRMTEGGAENFVQDSDGRLTNARAPTGAAGGVLSGTFPNPGFAVDMATQAELDAFTGANTGDETAARIGVIVAGAADKAAPVDADSLGLSDSAAANVLKKLTWANAKATLKTYFDGLYFSTGDIKDSLATSAAGWVVMSGRTIGSAASGAAERANADTEALYTLLWTNLTNTEAPVSGGRGASAAADFAANKTLTLPDARGRVLVGKDNMGGTTASRLTSGGSGVTGTTLGTAGGSETHTLTIAQMPSHDHASSALPSTDARPVGGGTNESATAGSVTGSTGGGGAHNNTQPSLVVNKFIKL